MLLFVGLTGEMGDLWGDIHAYMYVYLFGKGGGQGGGKSGRRQMPHGAFVWPSVGAVMVADTCVYIDTDTHALGI